MSTQDELLDWLRDAYAMERGLETSLRKLADSDALGPALHRQAEIHLAETQRHAEMVHECLESLGADASTFKTGLAKAVEGLKGLGTKLAKDEPIKDLLSAYAMEHFEIACYEALKAAGSQTGNQQVVHLAEQILEDEHRMAEWLKGHLPLVVAEYLRNESFAENG